MGAPMMIQYSLAVEDSGRKGLDGWTTGIGLDKERSIWRNNSSISAGADGVVTAARLRARAQVDQGENNEEERGGRNPTSSKSYSLSFANAFDKDIGMPGGGN